jgi:3-oxoacyl-[acyl-carrier protein] reductase
MPMRLKGRVALVTGGNAGLGKGIAKAMASEGAKIAICGRKEQTLETTVKEIESQGAEILGIKADVSSSKEVKRLFAEVVDRFGTLDILVNNAGIFRSHPKGVEDRMKHLDLVTTPVKKHSLQITRYMSDEEWEEMIKADLNSVFYCTREALNIMEDKGYGRIINIASISGISGISSHSPNYSAAKGGIVAFTRSVGHEVAGSGVCVNCIAPGYIATEPFVAGIERMGPERAARLMQLVAVGRLARIEEIASLAVYLATEEASYIVGQMISPNGGLVI